MLEELTCKQIKNLSLSELVTRMDQVLSYRHEEKYGHFPEPPPGFEFMKKDTLYLISQFIETKSISDKNEQAKRKLAYCAFRFITQVELLDASSGIFNIVTGYYQKDYWNSPTYCMQRAVLHQYQIVASRIALECFFHLIYMIDTGKLMDIKDKKKSSKFREFKNWILKKDNPYMYYFVGHIIKGFEFDRKYRTPEVHGTSGFATNLLLKLQKPEDSEEDTQFHLNRVVRNIWPRLIEILNEENPQQFTGVDEEFAMQYFRKDENSEEFFNFICTLLSPL